MARKKKFKMTKRLAVLFILILSIAVITIITQQFSAVNSNTYINVPTYGVLKCEESDNIISSPPSPNWQLISDRTIRCNDYSPLIQECDVLIKSPTHAEVNEDAGFESIIYERCDFGQCQFANAATNRVDLEIASFNQDENIDTIIDSIHLSPGEELRVAYRVSGLADIFGSGSTKPKARIRVSYRPFFINKYDIFSQATHTEVPGTEGCDNGEQLAISNKIVTQVQNGAGLLNDLDNSDSIIDIQDRNARIIYLSNTVPIVPQYNLFDNGDKYCKDKRIYNVASIQVANGVVYKVASPDQNTVDRTVDCCDSGDVPVGYYCTDDFKQARIPTDEETDVECSVLNPCPIVGTIFTENGAYTQSCVSGMCKTDITQTACSSNDDCPGGYCERDYLNPENTQCIYASEPTTFCPNSICEKSRGENTETCPADCADFEQDYSLIIAIGIFMVFMIIAVIMSFRKPKNKEFSL